MPRHTHFKNTSIRVSDHHDLHRLATKLGLSIADTLHLLISKNLRALHMSPSDELIGPDEGEDRNPPTTSPRKKT